MRNIVVHFQVFFIIQMFFKLKTSYAYKKLNMSQNIILIVIWYIENVDIDIQ